MHHFVSPPTSVDVKLLHCQNYRRKWYKLHLVVTLYPLQQWNSWILRREDRNQLNDDKSCMPATSRANYINKLYTYHWSFVFYCIVLFFIKFRRIILARLFTNSQMNDKYMFESSTNIALCGSFSCSLLPNLVFLRMLFILELTRTYDLLKTK